MSATIIEPTRVIEFVRRIFVVTYITAVPAITRPTIAWANTADNNQSCAIRRPPKKADAVFQICNSSCFTTIH